MNRIKLIIGTLLLTLTSLSFALEPLDTQIRSAGDEVHLIKTSVKDDILSVYIMIQNESDEDVETTNFNVEDIHYIAGGRRYPVLQDADDNWIASPYSYSGLFYTRYHDEVEIKAGKSVIGWIKFEAPAEDTWPIELNLPETLPFLIEKPE